MGSTQSQTCCKSSVSDVPPEVAVAGLPRETPAEPQQKEEEHVVKMEPGDETFGVHDIEKLHMEGAAAEKQETVPDAVVESKTYYPAELTISPKDILCGPLALKLWGNVVPVILLGGAYRAALWSGWRIPAALGIASTLSLGTWQVAWQTAKLGMGRVPTWVVLVELSLHWLLFAGEKYFLGPFQSRSNIIATFCTPFIYLPFGERKLFGIGAGMVLRALGALSLFMGSYLVDWRGDIQTEALQDMFYPVVAMLYKTLFNPIVQLTWTYFPGRRDCSALWLTSATATVAVSSEGFYYGGLALMLALDQGTDYQVVRRGAVSVATHAAFAILGRFNVLGTVLIFMRRSLARQFGWQVPELKEFGTQKDLVLRTSSLSAILSWAIMFLACVFYMLSSLSAHLTYGCERANPTCRYLYRPATYVVALLAGFGVLMTEFIVALGMRWLRQQRGSMEGGWTPAAMWNALNQLALPGMHCQPFATAKAVGKIPDTVNTGLSGVEGFLCLTPRDCAALLSTNFALALIMATIGSLLILAMKEAVQAGVYISPASRETGCADEVGRLFAGAGLSPIAFSNSSSQFSVSSETMLLSPHGALPDPTVQIVSVACGKDHLLILDSAGRPWALGDPCAAGASRPSQLSL
ncbi:hypothetical protein AK812_SmicGene39792 [Symbiodinium microadriaticum]|uniref:Uncharacterized protein n=1 Tax=Symbiodinium microadriaticum TaxID=2951 RepID=A0A1Q9CAB0_SYMMI|nr:hypothetical protein AK812_SmicGene39792 [Symbiodinium microadriaticum]